VRQSILALAAAIRLPAPPRLEAGKTRRLARQSPRVSEALSRRVMASAAACGSRLTMRLRTAVQASVRRLRGASDSELLDQHSAPNGVDGSVAPIGAFGQQKFQWRHFSTPCRQRSI
jgi:carboxylesterase type B